MIYSIIAIAAIVLIFFIYIFFIKIVYKITKNKIYKYLSLFDFEPEKVLVSEIINLKKKVEKSKKKFSFFFIPVSKEYRKDIELTLKTVNLFINDVYKHNCIYEEYESTLYLIIETYPEEKKRLLNESINYYSEKQDYDYYLVKYEELKAAGEDVERPEIINQLFDIYVNKKKYREISNLKSYYYSGIIISSIDSYSNFIEAFVGLKSSDDIIEILNHTAAGQNIQIDSAVNVIVKKVSSETEIFQQDFYLALSMYFYNSNSFNYARIFFEMLIEKYPENYDVKKVLAYILTEQKDYDGAIAYYLEMINAGYEYCYCISSMISIYSVLENIEYEIYYLKVYLSYCNAEDTNFIKRLANLSYQTGEYSEALYYFVQYTDITKNYSEIKRLFDCMYQLDDLEQLLNFSEKFAKNSSARHTITEYCRKFIDKNNYSEKLLEFIIQFNPSTEMVTKCYYMLMQIHFETERYDTAIENGMYHVKNNTQFKYKALDVILDSWIKLDKSNLAIKFLESILDKETDKTIKIELTYKLGKLHKTLGNYFKAKNIFEEILITELKYLDADKLLEDTMRLVNEAEQHKQNQEIEKYKKISESLLVNSREKFKIERYTLKNLIGKGGMGEVFLAHDTSLDRQVALKIMKYRGDDMIEKAMKEAKIAAKFNHPNIISIYDLGQLDKEKWYISMEYFEGKTMKELLMEEYSNGFGKELTIKYLKQIFNAMEYARQVNIVHRDLKPENFMIDKKSNLKVLDFGLAKNVSDDVTVSIDQNISGTVQYMAPEQISCSPVDYRTDYYAIGCIIYEMLTGKVLFEGKDMMSTLMLHMNPDIDSLFSDNFKENYGIMINILKKFLEIKKEDRYENLHEAYSDITESLQSQ